MLERMYDELNKYLFTLPEKMEHSQIEIKEQELGIIMPESMKDFYHYYGNSEEIRHAFYIFSPIENICIEDSALVFGYTSQMIAKLGIVLERLKSKYQSISFYLDDIKNGFQKEQFFQRHSFLILWAGRF